MERIRPSKLTMCIRLWLSETPGSMTSITRPSLALFSPILLSSLDARTLRYIWILNHPMSSLPTPTGLLSLFMSKEDTKLSPWGYRSYPNTMPARILLKLIIINFILHAHRKLLSIEAIVSLLAQPLIIIKWKANQDSVFWAVKSLRQSMKRLESVTA